MVRKIMTVCCLLACLAAMPQAASAATVYEGSISTTYITIFRDIVSKVDLNDDYVFYRSGQYEYTMIAGEITLNDGVFAADEAVCYVLVTTSGYNSDYQYSVYTLDSWSLSPESSLVYSSLGDYPDLIEKGDRYELAVLFFLGVALCMSLIRPVFNFTQRRRL